MATLGGQVQFRCPDGTCELYWLNADAEERRPDEDWPEFVARSAEQVLQGLSELPTPADIVAEGVARFAHLRELHSRGVALDEFLWFVLYFESQDTGSDPAGDSGPEKP